MQPKLKQKQLAEKLRKQGLSYSEIQRQVLVAKSSLSLWLKDISLSPDQKKRLIKLNTLGQQAGARTRHLQKIKQLKILKQEVEKDIPNFINNPFFVMGIVLYWAEGNKQKPWNPSQRFVFGNSDPRLVLLMRKWLKTFYGLEDSQTIFRLYIHRSANVKNAVNKWSKIMNIDSMQIKITLKKHKKNKHHLNTKNYKGLMNITVRKSTWLNRRIELWTNHLTKHYLYL